MRQPPAARTLAELLLLQAQRWPERVVQTFVDADGVSERSFAGLAHTACQLAVPLAARAQQGERVVLALAPGLEFVDILFACFVAGLVPTPVPLPHRAGAQQRLAAVVASCAPALVITEPALARAAPHAAEARGPAWIDHDSLRREAAGVPARLRPLRPASPDALAILQYTSGSTGSPRGVRLTHANALANLGAIAEAFTLDGDSIGVSWLPHFHDMGLIGTILAPVYAAFPMHRMAPARFMARPVSWLEAISTTGASVSGGPNFAYQLCASSVDDDSLARLSLARWRVAFVGAEPVRAATMASFARRFAPAGFEAQALLPCYGLAEATLFVTGVAADRAPETLRFDTRALDRGEALPVADIGVEAPGAAATRALVGCGAPRLEPRLSVEDRAGRELPAGAVGELVVRGASVSAGYFLREEPEAGGKTEVARTGDLGFIHGGQLFVVGRIKDLIIVRGRNIYPEDVEAEAGRGGPPLRSGRAAAFAVEGEAGEELVIVQEVRAEAEPPEGWDALAAAIYTRVSLAYELELRALALVPAGQVRLTSSGKIRRFECRARWLQGGLELLAHARGPASLVSALDELVNLDPDELRARLRDALGRWFEQRAGGRPAAGEPLASLGLDSMTLAELGAALASRGLAVGLPALAQATLASLVEDLAVAEPCAPPPRAHEASAHAHTGEASTHPRSDGPATSGELGFWHNALLAPKDSAELLARAAWIEGELDEEALAAALRALTHAWPMLRARLVYAEESVVRLIDAPPEQLLVRDALPDADADALLADMRAWALRPMDLARGPLMRARLLRGRGERRLLGLTLHHAIVDESALRRLADALARGYRRARRGAALGVEDGGVRPSAAPFARAEAELLASEQGQALAQRWSTRLARLPRGPTRGPRASDSPRPALVVERSLGGRAHARLRKLAMRHGCSPFTVLLALTAVTAGAPCVTIPADMRTRGAFIDTVAYLANLLPIIVEPRADEPITTLIERCSARLAEAIADQDFPYARMVAERPGLTPELVLSYHPELDGHGASAWAAGLADVELGLGELRLRTARLDPRHAQFLLHLRVVAHAGALHLSAIADARHHDAASLARLLARLELAITAALEPDALCSALLDSPTALEPARVEAPELDAPWLLDRVRAAAERHPDACALSSATDQLSYAGLLAAVDAIAAELDARVDGPEARVGLCLPRQPELLVALLATLEVGAAYVALDPSLPPARLRELATRARCELLLCAPGLVEGLDIPRLEVRRTLACAPRLRRTHRPALPASALACVLYTSGSTGAPKGVALTRGGLSNLLAWAVEAQGELLRGRVFAGTGIAFDLSTFELLGPLCAGGTVILGVEPLALPAAAGVTLLNSVPSLVAAMLAAGRVPTSLRGINLAGEALSWGLVELLRAHAPQAVIHNLYGPSETTTYSTAARLETKAGTSAARRPPRIGTPIATTSCSLHPASSDEGPTPRAGELYIGGAGLARGYLDQPSATAARFVPDPAGAPGARHYRSGDRCELDTSGHLHYLGRLDRQLKLAGVRVEPGEIEAALLATSCVRQAVVRIDSERRVLVAHVVGEGLDPQTLRRELSTRLPAAMVPAQIDLCDALPRTPRGKIDLATLAARSSTPRSYTAPRTALEHELAAVWVEALGVEKVGRDDEFFALGGHSLAATMMIARVQARYGVELPIRALFERPSLAALAEAVEAARWLERGRALACDDETEREQGSL